MLPQQLPTTWEWIHGTEGLEVYGDGLAVYNDLQLRVRRHMNKWSATLRIRDDQFAYEVSSAFVHDTPQQAANEVERIASNKGWVAGGWGQPKKEG